MPSTSTRADVAVIGLGAMGSAALYQLARHGLRAVGIDRFAPPHALGSSHGESRITRQGVGEGAAYGPFAAAAHRIWRELEEATGETLFTACGLLVMRSGDSDAIHHGQPDFVDRSIASARACAVPHEVLDGAAIGRRFPQFLGLTGAERVYFEPGGGYVRPEACIAAQLRRAVALGAEIRSGQAVRAIVPEAGAVRIETETETIRAERAVVAAGAWTALLLGAPFDRLLTVRRQVLHWFALDDVSAYGPAAPAFIWMHGPHATDYLYGFPPMPGERRLKLATEQYRTAAQADTAARAVAPEESQEFHRAHVQGRLAGVTARAVEAAACLYTITPDHHFIIDDHPDSDRILVVSACSGHGFKHSAGVGAAVAERIATGRSAIDLAPFRLARFAA
ncbi:MAG: N-methyl-L-tryptophan oxidase [Methylobacterium sp.]|uniref:N-methyl-L-tryptophan oxidase n=1 Tax=Methylobacterium sp. TaxID=409 RepID=UPI00258BC32C|nr:N-methyl-L-tryptophan oxidase [Methylobacterium sp.]MBY0296353.1 N-methyl-L-tryptophan oxidase [Methylobacterium sp.]